MKEKDLKIGKCYRKIQNKRSCFNVGVVFQITGVEPVFSSDSTRTCYCGVRLYIPNTPGVSTLWGKGSVFYTETFDTYEEVSEEEAPALKLAS